MVARAIGLLFLCFITANLALAQSQLTEADYNQLYCDKIGGKTQVKHDYISDAGEAGYIYVDCETENEVIEGGLDRPASLDSVQQALFAAHITNKTPVVVIYNSDGIEGKIQYRIKIGAMRAGVEFKHITIKANHPH